MPNQTLEVVPWTWRDGTVHLEMRLASFFVDDELQTHLDGSTSRFVTACGVPWWGITSSSGIGHTQRITCPECRELLRNATIEFAV